MIYFDNAASSFPKPKKVVDAVTKALTEYGANPGRGTHALAERAAAIINEARKELALFFGLSHKNHVLFYQNATMALNQAIKGFPFEGGDHVIATVYEHNSVRRPLEACVKSKGINVTYLSPSREFHEEKWADALEDNTKFIAVTHASNVTGEILPIKEIGLFAKKHGLTLLVDASQTAGILPINMDELGIDMLVFPGHKGLLGPQGTGALLLNEKMDLAPIIHGGTGSHSEQIEQPGVLPDKFESGTLNTPGIAGLLAGVKVVKERTLEAIAKHESELANYCIERLQTIENVRLYGPGQSKQRIGVVSFAIEGIDSHEIAMILDQHYGIAVRAGLHCSPMTHEEFGTIESGLIRVSFGFANTKEEVDVLIQALTEITGYF